MGRKVPGKLRLFFYFFELGPPQKHVNDTKENTGSKRWSRSRVHNYTNYMPIDMDPGEESEDPDWGRLPRERKFVERGINYFTMRVPNQCRLKLGPNYRPRRLLYPNSRKSIGACRAVAAQPVGLTDLWKSSGDRCFGRGSK